MQCVLLTSGCSMLREVPFYMCCLFGQCTNSIWCLPLCHTGTMGRITCITCITCNMCIIELFVLFVSLASLVLLDLLKIEKRWLTHWLTKRNNLKSRDTRASKSYYKNFHCSKACASCKWRKNHLHPLLPTCTRCKVPCTHLVASRYFL